LRSGGEFACCHKPNNQLSSHGLLYHVERFSKPEERFVVLISLLAALELR